MGRKECEAILNEWLETEYPDENVELGENWELIANIFFRAGYKKAKDEQK